MRYLKRLIHLCVALAVCEDGIQFAAPFSPTPLRPRARRPATHRFSLSKILGGVAVVGLAKAVTIIPQGDVAVVERLGKFHRRLDPGLHLCVPILERVRARLTRREQVFDIPPQRCITNDNAPLAADAVVYWRVVDPEKAVYAIVDLELAIQNLVLTQLRAEVGKLTLDETFSAREKLNAVLLEELDVASWGIEITRVEVRDIAPNAEIVQAMEQQMAAERTKRAAVITSQGQREAAVNKAEGEAQSKLIDARARAEALTLQAEAEAKRLEAEARGAAEALKVISITLNDDAAAATQFQLLREQLATQRDLATSQNAKVILSGGDEFFAKVLAIYNITQTMK